MPYDELLAERVRGSLTRLTNYREQRMMGALCFMVNDHMCCGVTGNSLMVRTGSDEYTQALKQPYVRPMEVGVRKPRGFVLVDAEGLLDHFVFEHWIDKAYNFTLSLPNK